MSGSLAGVAFPKSARVPFPEEVASSDGAYTLRENCLSIAKWALGTNTTGAGSGMMLSILWQVLLPVWVASEVFIAIATRTKSSSGQVRDRGSFLMLWVVITASVTISSSMRDAGHGSIFGGAHWLKAASVIVLVFGIAIRATAILALGKAFSSNVAIQHSQKVCKRGLYRFVRHPSYLGLLLIFLAVGLHSRNWLGLAVALVPTTAGLLYRIHVEESALTAAFGDEYVEYSRATKRLLPGIY